MKHIFISIPWFHPAFRAGGPVQSVANLVLAGWEEFRFSIFCGDRDLNGEVLEGIQTDCWTAFAPGVQVWYAADKNRSQTADKLLTELKPDFVWVIGLYDRDFNIPWFRKANQWNVIFSVRGMLHPGALSQKAFKKFLFLQFLKWKGWHRQVRYHATDTDEAAHIRNRLGANVPVSVAGNLPRLFHLKPAEHQKDNRLHLVTLALISPMKNHALVLEALQTIDIPITWHVGGPVKDADYWAICEQKIRALPQNIDVIYHGEITAPAVHDFLAKGDVFIMPSKSENFGHALLEAMSAGLPVITSHHTPWNQLEQAHAGINTENEAGAIERAIRFFANMPASDLHQWRTAAANYAKSRINLETLRSQYRALFS